MQYINITNADNNPVIYFNTGLDARSFARTKMSQCITEPGYVVNSDGTHEVWKPGGVDEVDGFMQFWGRLPLSNAQRLDHLINEISDSRGPVIIDYKKLTGGELDSSDLAKRQNALRAVIYWIRAKMFLGDTHTIRNPGAAFICRDNADGKVFLAPENIANRCLLLESSDQKQDSPDRFNSPDLKGLDSAAFCAAVMIYSIMSKTHPYPSVNNSQDMRDGIFLPVSLAVPNLNEELSGLIQSALMLPVHEKKAKTRAADILSGFLKLLTEKDNQIRDISALFNEITDEKLTQTDVERKNFTLRQNSIIKTKRFFSRNRTAVLISFFSFLFVLFIAFSMIDSYARRPTTEGMHPENVIHAYFNAFSNLDFTFMEACIWGANKNDVNAAVNMTAIVKTRQAYEATLTSPVIPASVWKENGGELPAPDVFGVTDIIVTHISGSEAGSSIVFRADYYLWPFYEEIPYIRSDLMTLKLDRKNNWRITEIARTEKQ
ncbi:MAG: hypothetical protein FWC21_07225 [Treponema sp.]|nr:hypothetical protein [Treponema sp.]